MGTGLSDGLRSRSGGCGSEVVVQARDRPARSRWRRRCRGRAPARWNGGRDRGPDFRGDIPGRSFQRGTPRGATPARLDSALPVGTTLVPPRDLERYTACDSEWKLVHQTDRVRAVGNDFCLRHMWSVRGGSLGRLRRGRAAAAGRRGGGERPVRTGREAVEGFEKGVGGFENAVEGSGRSARAFKNRWKASEMGRRLRTTGARRPIIAVPQPEIEVGWRTEVIYRASLERGRVPVERGATSLRGPSNVCRSRPRRGCRRGLTGLVQVVETRSPGAGALAPRRHRARRRCLRRWRRACLTQ